MKQKLLFLKTMAVCAMLLMGVSAKGATYYVKTNGSTAWANVSGGTVKELGAGNEITAFTTINASATGTDTYYFAPGTYNINATLALTTGKIYGGFSGIESSVSDLTTRVTSDLDGNGIVEPWEFSNVVTFTTSATNSKYSESGNNQRFVTISGTGGEVNGLTFSDYNYYYSTGGSGVIVLGQVANPPTVNTTATAGIMNNCIVRKIKNTNGSGIIMMTNAASQMNQCLIEDCNVTGSGTVYLNTYGGTVSNSVIRNNYVSGNGGAVFLSGTLVAGSAAVVKTCAIYNNTSGGAGGAIYGTGTTSTKGIEVINCTVVNNYTTATTFNASSVELINNGLIENSIVVSDLRTEVRPNNPCNYVVSSIYGAAAGSALSPSTNNNNTSGIADVTANPKTTFDNLGFKTPTTFIGAVGNVGEANYDATKAGNIKTANFSITSATSAAVTTTSSNITTSYTADSKTVPLAGTVPTSDMLGVSRGSSSTIGAYQYVDVTAPTVSISSDEPSTTSRKPIPVTITFNESVTGFVVGDLTLGNCTASGFSGSGTTYTVNLLPTALGTVTLDIAAGVAADGATNGNTVATQFTRTSIAKEYYVRPTSSNLWSSFYNSSPSQVITNSAFSAFATSNTTASAVGTALDTYYFAAGNYTTPITTALTGGKFYGGFSGNESTIDLNARATSDIDQNGITEPWELTNTTTISAASNNYAGTATTGSRFITISGIGAEVNGITLTDFNMGSYPGAIVLGQAATTPSNITNNEGKLTRCIVRKIKSSYGVLMLTNPASVVDQCLIENNITSNTYGAGIYFNKYGGVVSNSVIRNNKANTSGGAIYAGNGASGINLKALVNNCVIYNNEATTNGGAIYATSYSTSESGIEIVNSTIVNNKTGSGTASVEIVNNGVIANSIVTGDPIRDINVTSGSGNYIESVAYNTKGASSATFSPATNMASGKAPADFGFKTPTTVQGYVGIDAGTTDYINVHKANFAITSSTSPAITTTGLTTVPASYGSTINIYSTISATDMIGFNRSGNYNLGAYQATYNTAPGATITITQPTTIASLVVKANNKLTIDENVLVTIGSLTLESDENGTATLLNSGTFTGTLNAKQYLGSARNWYVSSPVSSASAPATNMDYYYEYMEGGNNTNGNNEWASQPGSPTLYWKGLANGTTMEVGKGYIAKTNAGTTVQFSGTPNNGNIETTFNLTRNDAKGKGFNLVGNPYPSYLDWSKLAAANTNLMSTAWFRTQETSEQGGDYTFASVNVEDPQEIEIVANNANTTITKYIPPMQAFWVRVKTETEPTTMSFTNQMREHQLISGDLMKAPKVSKRSRLRLLLMNGIETDETLIYFDSKATNDFNGYDSPKMLNNSTKTPDLYSKAGSERLVINGLNAITDNLELALGFSLNAATTLKLKATEISNFPAGTRIYLLDKQESTQTELAPETEYNFSTSSATTNNESRFSLIFRTSGSATGIENDEKQNTQVFVNTANQITIIAPERSNYCIYNAMGQMIENGIVNSKFITQNSKLTTGVYVVKVGNQSTKVIIK